MKKRLFSIGLIAVLGLSSVLMMTGCGKDSKTPYGDYDLSEYVKVGDYKGLEYKTEKVSVSEEEIRTEIERRCELNAETKSEEKGVVENGDTVNISYAGTMNGKTFKGGSADNVDLGIGSGRFIDGFEEGLIGKSVGDKVILDLKFPEDYGKEEFNGKDVTFEVKINSIQVEVVPEYNLDFVKKYTDFDNLKDYEKSVKSDLLKQKEGKADMEMKQVLWEKVLEKCEAISYPKEKEEQIQAFMDSYKSVAESNDVEWEEYLKTIGVTEEEMKEKATEYAETNVFQEMVLYYIADKEGIEVSNEEFQEFVDTLLTQSGMDKDTFKSTYNMTAEEYCEQQGIRTSILLDRVLEKVMEYGKDVSEK